MEERSNWRGAFATAWDNLTGVNNDGSIRIVRLLFFLVFIMGAAWAGWSYYNSLDLLHLEESAPTPAPDIAASDKKILDSMITSVSVTSNRRSGSPTAVDILANNPRNPFGQSRLEEPIAPVDEGPLIDTPPPQVVIDYPPMGITLRGIMIMGNERVAVMDIPNVGSGMIVKAGDTFMQRKGRVVRIAPDKVVVNWGGKNWDIAPSF